MCAGLWTLANTDSRSSPWAVNGRAALGANCHSILIPDLGSNTIRKRIFFCLPGVLGHRWAGLALLGLLYWFHFNRQPQSSTDQVFEMISNGI